MIITVCGSVTFAKEMVEAYDELEKLGYQPKMHQWMFGIADGTATEVIKGIGLNHASTKRKYEFIKWWYNSIKASDAILVINLDKNGIKNYIGGNGLMEIGFAYVLDKKIFLLNPAPDLPIKDEVLAMSPIIINGDLAKIK